MGKVILYLSSILVLVVISPAQAMTCGHFNTLGGTTNTVDQALNSPATEAQAAEFKEIIASHVGDLAFNSSSAKAKALQLVRKNNQLTMLLRESLAMTRAFCIDRINDPVKNVAIEQFDYLLDAIVKKQSEDWGSFEHLSATASNLNKTLPMMVDKITECFVVTPLDHELDFSYRVTTLEAAQINIDANDLKNERTNYACFHPNIRPLIDRGISMRYSYFDKNKKFVISTLIRKSDCNQ